MDFTNIGIATASLAGMGFVFAVILGYASQKFAVEVDPRVTQVREVLPSANCGGCGYPGCDGFAAAVVRGEAKPNGCPVGGSDVADKVAKIMGLDADSGVKKVAHVICKGIKEKATDDFYYNGINDCRAANAVMGGDKSCKFGCMGYGTCERLCPFDAIHVNDRGIAEVDQDKCVACGICIEACPKNVITLVDYAQRIIVNCNNKERGARVKKNCQVACIACGMCEKACKFDAIHVIDNKAVVDYDKCKKCMACVTTCPTKAIYGALPKPKVRLN